MPKLKTHKGTAKRIKLSPTGKVRREQAGVTHFLNKKSESRKRSLSTGVNVTGAIKKNLKRAIGA